MCRRVNGCMCACNWPPQGCEASLYICLPRLGAFPMASSSVHHFLNNDTTQRDGVMIN